MLRPERKAWCLRTEERRRGDRMEAAGNERGGQVGCPPLAASARLLDTQRSRLPRSRILRPEHDPHRLGIEIDFPGGNARTDELLSIIRREPFRGRVEEFHQLHAMLEIAAAIPARRDANPDIVIELTTDEPLGHLEQPSHDYALQADAVFAAETSRQRARAGGIGA